MTACVHVRRSHFILFIIRIDQGQVEVWDPLTWDADKWKSARQMLQRYIYIGLFRSSASFSFIS